MIELAKWLPVPFSLVRAGKRRLPLVVASRVPSVTQPSWNVLDLAGYGKDKYRLDLF